MLNVRLSTGSFNESICDININKGVTGNEIWNYLEENTGLLRNDFYILHNGKLLRETDVCLDGSVTLVPRLFGGKGGFGSMLRAIGAQIEKTTNREACRDLSGRRLRDINEEKRLKAWIEKQAKREEEAAERKKRKLQKLSTEPKHEFKDQNYEKERSILTERVGDAVEEGFKFASVGTSGLKRKAEDEKQTKSNKRKTLLDFDIDSDELDTSDDSSDDEDAVTTTRKSNQQVSSDSGHSSGAEKICKSSTDEESNQSLDSTDKKTANNDKSNTECDGEETCSTNLGESCASESSTSSHTVEEQLQETPLKKDVGEEATASCDKA